MRAVVDGVEDNSDETWEDPRGRGRRGRGGRDMGRRGPPGQQEEEKEYAVSCWHPTHSCATNAVFLPAGCLL